MIVGVEPHPIIFHGHPNRGKRGVSLQMDPHRLGCTMANGVAYQFFGKTAQSEEHLG
jgi:hypothetical protein